MVFCTFLRVASSHSSWSFQLRSIFFVSCLASCACPPCEQGPCMQALGVLVVERATCQQHTKHNNRMTTTSAAVYRSHTRYYSSTAAHFTTKTEKLLYHIHQLNYCTVKALCSSNTKAHLEAILPKKRTAKPEERDADRRTWPTRRDVGRCSDGRGAGDETEMCCFGCGLRHT